MVRGNQGRWIKLHGGDPLEIWAYEYFHANEGEFDIAAADAERAEYYERADREYDRMRDDRMMARIYGDEF